jgi:hypothetical protein
MENLTISANYTDSIENLTFFAMEKGWTPTVMQEVEVEKENEEDGTTYTENEMQEVPNPVTLQQFLQNWARQYLIIGISEPILAFVERSAMQQMNSQKEQYLNTLENNLNVNVD